MGFNYHAVDLNVLSKLILHKKKGGGRKEGIYFNCHTLSLKLFFLCLVLSPLITTDSHRQRTV